MYKNLPFTSVWQAQLVEVSALAVCAHICAEDQVQTGRTSFHPVRVGEKGSNYKKCVTVAEPCGYKLPAVALPLQIINVWMAGNKMLMPLVTEHALTLYEMKLYKPPYIYIILFLAQHNHVSDAFSVFLFPA